MPGLGTGLGLGLSNRRGAIGDITPSLSSPTAIKSGQTGATNLSVYTNVGDGTVYLGIYPEASTPSAADVKAGTGATVATSKAVTAVGTQTFTSQTGLSAATQYKAHYVHESAAALTSSVATTTAFWTDPGLYGTEGVAEIQISDAGSDVTFVLTEDSVEIFNGTLTVAQLQAAAHNLISPSIAITGGAAQEVGQEGYDTLADRWIHNGVGSISRQWDRDGSPISGATASTYTYVSADGGTNSTLDKVLESITATSNTLAISAPAFVPTDLVDLVAWYDPDDAASITDAGAGAVSDWANQITGHNLTQGTAANRFITGVQTENSTVNVMQSSGSNDCMIYTTNDLVYDNHEVWIICRPSALSKDLYGSSAVGDGHVLIQVGGTNLAHNYWTSAGQQTVSGPSISTNELMLVHVYVDGTTIFCGKNGVGSTSTISGTKSGSGKQICLGARYNNYSGSFAGNIGDVVITDAALSLADRNSLGSYLCTKYGLTWTTMT